MTNVQNTAIRQVGSVRWANESRGSLLAEIDGVSVFVPDDALNSDRIAIQAWQDAGNAIAQPVAPPTAVPEIISDRQFFQQLAVQEVITQADALSAVKTGTIPPALQTLISELPADQQFGAEMIVSGAVEFHRQSALVAQIAQAYGWTDAQLDALWSAASAL